MTVALADFGFAVDGMGLGAVGDLRDPGTEAHGSALVRDVLLLFEQINNGIHGGGVELGAIGAGQAADVASKLDSGHLHAQAEPEEWHRLLARKLRRADLA